MYSSSNGNTSSFHIRLCPARRNRCPGFYSNNNSLIYMHNLGVAWLLIVCGWSPALCATWLIILLSKSALWELVHVMVNRLYVGHFPCCKAFLTRQYNLSACFSWPFGFVFIFVLLLQRKLPRTFSDTDSTGHIQEFLWEAGFEGGALLGIVSPGQGLATNRELCISTVYTYMRGCFSGPFIE